MAQTGGVRRDHHASTSAKLTFAALHTAIISLCIWLTYGGFDWANPQRAQILLLCATLYWLRHLFTLFVLLKRRVAYSEALGLSCFIACFEIGFLLLGAGALGDAPQPLGGIDWVALGLVLIGSYLNTGSELQRHIWKKRPASKGRCYTEGLFKYSAHINYFGDTVLFTGWAILAASLFAWIIPIFVTAGFVFYHIPALDAYLSERYGAAFDTYARRTAKFVPFLY